MRRVVGVGDAPRVHELDENVATLRVHRVRHASPAGHVRIGERVRDDDLVRALANSLDDGILVTRRDGRPMYANKTLAPTIASIRPKWLKQLDADPFNPNRARGNQPPLEFFVPIRDQPRGEREEAKPHEVNVFVPGGANFLVRFKDDQFILYSVGRDGAKNWASRVQNTWELATGADYLIWPPVLSLYRQHLIDTGALK